MLRFVFETFGAGLLFLVAAYAAAAIAHDRTRFSLVAAVGTLFLGIDELSNIHERLGKAMYEDWGWPQPPVVNHHDDLIVMGIGVAGLAMIAFFRREVLRDRTFASLLFAGLALFAAAIAWDSVANPSRTYAWWTEESLEFAGAAVMVLAFRWRLGVLRVDRRRGGTVPGLSAGMPAAED